MTHHLPQITEVKTQRGAVNVALPFVTLLSVSVSLPNDNDGPFTQ